MTIVTVFEAWAIVTTVEVHSKSDGWWPYVLDILNWRLILHLIFPAQRLTATPAMETAEQKALASQLRIFAEKLHTLCKAPNGFSDDNLLLNLKREVSGLNNAVKSTQYPSLTLLPFVNPIFRAAHEKKERIRSIDIEQALLAYERKRDDLLKAKKQIRGGEEGQDESAVHATEESRAARHIPLQQPAKQLSVPREKEQEPLQEQSRQAEAIEGSTTQSGPEQSEQTPVPEATDVRSQSPSTKIPVASAASEEAAGTASSALLPGEAARAEPTPTTVHRTAKQAVYTAISKQQPAGTSQHRRDVAPHSTPRAGIQHANPNSIGKAVAARSAHTVQSKETRSSSHFSKQNSRRHREESNLPSQQAARGPFLAPPGRSRSSRRYSSGSSNDSLPAVGTLSLPHNTTHVGSHGQQLRGILKPTRKTATFASPVVQDTLRRDGYADNSPTPEDIVSVKQEMEELNITDPRQGMALLKQHRAFKDTRQPSVKSTRRDGEALASEEDLDESGKVRSLRPRRAASTDIDLQRNVPSGYEGAEQDWPSPADIGDQEEDYTFDPDQADGLQEDEDRLGTDGESEQEGEDEETEGDDEAAYEDRGRSRSHHGGRAAYANRKRSVSMHRRSGSPQRRRSRSKTPGRQRQPEDIKAVQGVAGKAFRASDRIAYVEEACGSCIGGKYDCYVWLSPLNRLTCVRCYLRNRPCNFVQDSKTGVMTHPSKFTYDLSEVVAPLEGIASPVAKRIASRSPSSSRRPPSKKQYAPRVPSRSQSRARSVSGATSEVGTVRGFRRFDEEPVEFGDDNDPGDFEPIHSEQDEQDDFYPLRSEQGEMLSTIAKITSDLKELRQENESLRTWVESYFVRSAKKGKKRHELVVKEIAQLADASTQMRKAVAKRQKQLNDILKELTSGCDAVLAEMVSAVQSPNPYAGSELFVDTAPSSSALPPAGIQHDDDTNDPSEAPMPSHDATQLAGQSVAKQNTSLREDPEEAVDWNNSDDDNYAAVEAPTMAGSSPPHLIGSTPDRARDPLTKTGMDEGPSPNAPTSPQAVEDVMFDEYIWADGEGNRQGRRGDDADELQQSNNALLLVALRTPEDVAESTANRVRSPAAVAAEAVMIPVATTSAVAVSVAATEDVAMVVDVEPQRLAPKVPPDSQTDIQMSGEATLADISGPIVPLITATTSTIAAAASTSSATPTFVTSVESIAAVISPAVITPQVTVSATSSDVLTPAPVDGPISVPIHSRSPVHAHPEAIANVSFTDANHGPFMPPESSQESPQSSTTLHSQETSNVHSTVEDIEMSNGEAAENAIAGNLVPSSCGTAKSPVVVTVNNAAKDLVDNGPGDSRSDSLQGRSLKDPAIQPNQGDACDLGEETSGLNSAYAVPNTTNDLIPSRDPTTTTMLGGNTAGVPAEVIVPPSPVVQPPSSPLTSLSSQQGDLPSPAPVRAGEAPPPSSPQLRVATRSRSLTPGVTTRSRSNSKVHERPKPVKPASKSRTPSKKH